MNPISQLLAVVYPRGTQAVRTTSKSATRAHIYPNQYETIIVKANNETAKLSGFAKLDANKYGGFTGKTNIGVLHIDVFYDFSTPLTREIYEQLIIADIVELDKVTQYNATKHAISDCQDQIMRNLIQISKLQSKNAELNAKICESEREIAHLVE